MTYYTVYPARIETDTGSSIPRDPGNADYQALLDELADLERDIDHPDGVFLREPWPVSLADHQEKLLADLADYRYQREIAGISVGGAEIRTDRESQSKIHEAYTSLKDGLVPAIRWKAGNGWFAVDTPMITGIATAVSSHVQACFAREEALGVVIAALESVEAAKSFDIAAEWAN